MREEVEIVPVRMVRRTLADVPHYILPAPYGFRWCRSGDEEHWFRIWRAADIYKERSAELFRREFGRDDEALRIRQLYLCSADGTPVGTATAWLNDHYTDRNWGRVHWVAIVPELQGRGLSKPLMTACLARMVALGYEGAYLTTDSPRIAAISLYLQFGFRPQIGDEDERKAWRAVRDELAPELQTLLDAGAEPP